MNKVINASLQIVPLGHSEEMVMFDAINAAIAVIDASGLRYQVGPMSTVIEGRYEEVMDTIQKAQAATLDKSDQIVTSIHLHIDKHKDVSFEHKLQTNT